MSTDSKPSVKIKNIIPNTIPRKLAPKMLHDRNQLNGCCDFTKKLENKFALQFHQSKMLQIHIQKVNEKPQN